MGRWAQRRRGGGGATHTPLVQMVSATAIGAFNIDVAYTGNITAAAFAVTAFATIPSVHQPTLIAQDGPTGLNLTFADNISAETDLEFTNGVSGVLSPDAQPIT